VTLNNKPVVGAALLALELAGVNTAPLRPNLAATLS
jgi:hypothetical protein